MILFIVAVGVGALGIAWMNANLWQRMQDLANRFGDVRSERFYQGVYLRVDLRRMNELLLQYHLRGEARDLEQFSQDARKLRDWIASLPRQVALPEEEVLCEELRQAYDGYLGQTAVLQDRSGLFGPTRRQVDRVHETLATISQPILDLSEKLNFIQRREFNAFMKVSQTSLDEFQKLIQWSSVLIVGLGFLVVGLVYRGMVKPLRIRLSQREATLIRQEKLAALGTLAAGVAHEIRNPLTAIKFRLFSLKRSLPPGLANNENTTVIDGEIQRLERIVKDFIQLARPSDPQWVQVPAAKILEEIQTLLRPELQAASIRFRLQAPDDIWLRVDPQQLKQVMINLIRNAMESIGRDGDITLGVAEENAILAGAARQVAVLRVTDTGKGIPPEARQRLFDPFFTTKEGGTGLGLSIASRIVDKLGGELHFETELNRGTTFRVLLPRVTHNESEDPVGRR